ncbi:hypothetical protein GCM10027028_01220 [Streptomyces sundarbansensis]
MAVAGAVGAAPERLSGCGGFAGSDGSGSGRCGTGMAAEAGGTPPESDGVTPEPDGTTPAGPSVTHRRAPAGSSRSGLPRAGRIASGVGRPVADGGGAGRSGEPGPLRSGAPGCPDAACRTSGPVRSEPPGCPDMARWTSAGAVVVAVAVVTGVAGKGAGAGGASGAADTSPAICRSGMAGRRATVSGGASRCGRTAAGLDGGRTAAAALLPGPSVGRPEEGRAPAYPAGPDDSADPVEPEECEASEETGEAGERDEPAGPDEPDERGPPYASDEPGEVDAPDRGAEPDGAEGWEEDAVPAAARGAEPVRAVSEGLEPDPDPAAFAGPDTGPDRAGSAGPADLAVLPGLPSRPAAAAERDTFTVPGVPADDGRAADPEAPRAGGLPGPEAPDDDRPAAPDDDRLAGPAAPDDDRLAPGAADRWTGGEPGPGLPGPFFASAPALVPVPRADALPAEAGGRSPETAGDSLASSASAGRTARSSSGPPGDAEGRAEPGRATPWMRPAGADGRTAWPSSPPRDGFCQEARCERNRSPSLTPIEDRATVTDGGATRRQPPSQPALSRPPPLRPPPSAPPSPASADTAGPAAAAGPADLSSRPVPPPPPLSGDGATDRRRSVRRSQFPNPTRSPDFVDAGVDPRYLPHPLLTLAVGEVENVLTLPMEVVGDVRDLLPQPGKRVRHDSPRRPPERSTSNDPWHSGQVTAACVWPSLLIRR